MCRKVTGLVYDPQGLANKLGLSALETILNHSRVLARAITDYSAKED